MTDDRVSMDVNLLKSQETVLDNAFAEPESQDLGTENINLLDEQSQSVDEEAFAKAAQAKKVKPVRSMFARRMEQLILPPADVEAAINTLKLRARELDVNLKSLLAWVVIIAVSLQLLVADFFLIYYVVWSPHKLSDAVLIAWLSASVVEVIGIVAVIARNLFPDRRKTKSVSA